MIESTLLNIAMMTGRLQFEEKEDHYRLVVAALGAKITLARVTKKAIADAMKPKLTVVT
jgi:hypothetical protein